MMGYKDLLFLFCSFLLCCQHVYGVPVTKGVDEIQFVTTYLPSYATVLISLGALLLLAYFVLGCVCCPNKSIKALSYQNGFPVSRLNENTFENPTEITIFPPHSTVIDLQPVSPSFPIFDDKVTFEPLPDILPKKFTSGQSAACSSRPAHFSALLKSKVSLHDWFDDPNSNFPREQLQYLQEIGCGWFGRIVEGEASQICDKEEKTAVIVKILREEASPSEHLHFLHEVRPYRDLKHPNVIQLFGRCLESDPFLLIMEHSTCDLKSYLMKQDIKDSLLKDGIILQMVSQIAAGLRYMHDKGFCHMDLAAHNCFVCSGNVIKIGDYGVSFDRWKGDYYCLGDIALPIRWYSPEILQCSETTIETKEITKEANVWAFGVVIWEIVQFGKLPYEELSDEEVLQKVLIEKCVQLSPPTVEFAYDHEIFLVMRECWKPRKHRPPMEKIESFIMQFCSDKLSIKAKELSFEERWNSIQPRITEISSYTGTESSSYKFENDFSTRSDIQNYSSDNEILSSFEMSFDILPKTGFSTQLSPSLNVLNGSIDELTENDVYLNSISLSCGKYDADTLSNISDKDNFQMEEDKDNLQSNNIISEQISAAIRDLDLVLASQPDSSRNSTLQRVTKPVTHNSETVEKEVYVNGVSDLSNISESSCSKSSNLSEHLDPIVNRRNDDVSAGSDLNGNCSSYHSSLSNNQVQNAIEVISICKSKNEKSESVILNDQNSVDIIISDKIDDKILHIESDNEHKDIEITNNDKNMLSSVPDIVIHESPSIITNEDSDVFESEKNQNSSCNQDSPKIFRFVFKEASNPDPIDITNQDFSKELAHDLTESVKKSDRSKPLTSTPVKSNSKSFSASEYFDNSNDINKNNEADVFYETESATEVSNFNETVLDFNSDANLHSTSNDILSLNALNSQSQSDLNVKNQATINSTDFDHFTTAQSSLGLSKNDESISKVSEKSNNPIDKTCLFHNENDITLNCNGVGIHDEICNIAIENSNNSNTMYISAENGDLKVNLTKNASDIISPPNGYVSSDKPEIQVNGTDADDSDNQYLEDSKASETVSPPQGFQDDGLAVLNDSFSESKTSFDQDFSTSAECGSSENLENYLEDDPISQANISAAKLLETSFPEVASKSFTYENCAEFSGNMRPRKNGSRFNLSDSDHRNHSHIACNDHQNYNLYENIKPAFHSYDQMIVEDLDTGEQTVINESYSVCDDYENSAESDEILKINTETDEAIIVDSSEALIGFVPSRSIELLQEFEVIPPMNHPSYALDEEKESSDSMNIDAYNSASPSPAAMKHNSSPYESPESTYPQQPYRNFCLQNQVIEEEITDEIVSPSSFHSSSSYCSNEIFLDEEKMSQSSESPCREEMFETSVMPSVEHLYVSDDGMKSDISSSECSPMKENKIINSKYRIDSENNHISGDQEDVMHSYQPTQSVRWLSDDTLDVDRDEHSPIIIEGREILAGDLMQTCELTTEDIASALSQLEAKAHLHGLTPNRLSVSPSPSPFSSVESSPCRDTVYTPDFESDSDDTGSGASCSSTSGSFECIHNKFKNTVDISKVVDDSDKSLSSREQSPMKIFSKTWDCHATPTRGVLVTPEKKFNAMRKSVSFHEEDPQVVFEYPPASDSSEDEYPSDDIQEFCQKIDYVKYADWDLQVCDGDDLEAEEILEIEELDSEPYVRRPPYSSLSVGPLNRPMLYTLTSGFSDEDFDLSDVAPPSSLYAPSNSPDEKENAPVSSSKVCELIQNHLSSLVYEENRLKMTEAATDSLSDLKDGSSVPVSSVQESVASSVGDEKVVIDECLPECQASGKGIAVHKDDNAGSVFGRNVIDDEDIIIEELEENSESESSPFKEENKVSVNAGLIHCHDIELINDPPINKVDFVDEIISLDISYEDFKAGVLSDVSIPNSSFQLSHALENGETAAENFMDDLNTQSKEFKKSLYTNDVIGAPISENAFNNDEVLENNDLVESNIPKLSCVEVSDENKLKNSEFICEQENLINILDDISEKVNSFNNDETKNDETGFISEACPFDVINPESSVTKSPVHMILCELEHQKHVIDVLDESSYVSNNLSEIPSKECMGEAINTSEILILNAQTNSKDRNVVVNQSANTSDASIDSSDKTIYSTCSTDTGLSVSESKNSVDILINENDLFNVSSKSDSNVCTENNKSLDSTTLCSENNHVSGESLFSAVAQGGTQLNDSSSGISPEVLRECTEDKMCKNEAVLKENKSADSATGTDLPFSIASTIVSHEEPQSAVATKREHAASLLPVPKIIVTPASGSESEDELEEFLRGQLELLNSEVSPQEDFSVTSEFSSRPFDDVFGSYVSGDSSEYIEAYNFEFENGNFFEEFVDYPLDLQTGISDRLCPDDGRQKRSSSLPLMTENLSDDDSLTIKSDSSLVYDSSKGITRL